MVGLDSINIERSIKAKPAQFMPLYEELDRSYYYEEALLTDGQDGRSAVPDTTIYPYSAHGRLVMMFNGYTLYGSGTLISLRYVLTAAHNLYSHRFRKEADSIYFIPALNGSDCPYGIIGVRRRFYPKEYEEGISEDYAILEIEKDIENAESIINMKIFEQDKINGIECSIYGYPGYINGVFKHLQYGMSGLVTLHHQNNTLLKYKIDTDEGQSGSSICYYSQQEDKYFTIGVHVRAYKALGYNEGTLLTLKELPRLKNG
jgi:glutamyl endopeptidase